MHSIYSENPPKSSTNPLWFYFHIYILSPGLAFSQAHFMKQFEVLFILIKRNQTPFFGFFWVGCPWHYQKLFLKSCWGTLCAWREFVECAAAEHEKEKTINASCYQQKCPLIAVSWQDVCEMVIIHFLGEQTSGWWSWTRIHLSGVRNQRERQLHTNFLPSTSSYNAIWWGRTLARVWQLKPEKNTLLSLKDM